MQLAVAMGRGKDVADPLVAAVPPRLGPRAPAKLLLRVVPCGNFFLRKLLGAGAASEAVNVLASQRPMTPTETEEACQPLVTPRLISSPLSRLGY